MGALPSEHPDPEKRIAELDRRLDAPGSHGSSRFEALTAPPTTKQMMKYTQLYMLGGMALLGVLYMGLFMIGAMLGATSIGPIGSAVAFFSYLVLAMPVFGVLRRRLNREKRVLVGIGNDGLTVSARPGEVFSLDGAQLGRWTPEGCGAMTKGTALHLGSGRRRFVIGGRDHRALAEAPLDAPPVDVVDAWLWARDFDDLLTAIGGSLARPMPADGKSARCLLSPNFARMISSSVFGAFKNTATVMRLKGKLPRPSLAIDVGEVSISVVNLETNALIASAAVAQVTATPATSTRSSPRMGTHKTPVLVLDIPGASRLSIGCQDLAGAVQGSWTGSTKLVFRFAWRDEVASAAEPEFVVSELDWLILVDKFGLAKQLEDRARGRTVSAPHAAPAAPPKRKLWVYGVIIAALMFVVAPAMMMVGGSFTISHQRKEEQLKAESLKPFALPFTDLRVPHGVAVDAAGNVYVSDSHAHRVLKLAAGTNVQTVLPFTGLDLCDNNIEAASAGVAMSAAGDVYVSDSCHNRVLMLKAGSSTQTELPFKGLDFPEGVAVDGAGTVYVVDHAGSQVQKLPAGSSKPVALPKPGTGAAPSGGLAVDSAGNLYVGFSKSRYKARAVRYLLRLAPGSSAWTDLPLPPDNNAANLSSGEQDLAVDTVGNLYAITSTDTRGVWKLAPGSQIWTPLPGAPQFIDPLGLAVDTRGNVYVTDHVGSRATGSALPWEGDDARGFVLKLPVA